MASVNASSLATYLGNYVDHFAILGAFCFASIAFIVGRKMLSVTLRSIRRSLAVDLKKHGRWAVITGCTDGIGKCYALQLAEKGMDVVLISRNPQKLSDVAQEIDQCYNVQVKVITADFKKTDIYENIKRELTGLDIGILVNNVGMHNASHPCYHCETEDFEQFNIDIVNVNILSCVMMTGIVLPDMLERKRGIIINIASGVALRPAPFLTIYSATKAFIKFFTEALNMEYSSHGVTIQVVMPNLVQSNMTQKLAEAAGIGAGLQYPTAGTYVRRAIQTIGRESTTAAYWPHDLEQFLGSLAPDSLIREVMFRSRNNMVELLKKQ